MALSLPLPVSEYTKLDKEDIQEIDWKNLSFDDEYGYIASVTLEAPPSIHDRLQEFPPAPHKHQITYSMLSPYAKRALAACCDNPESYSATKLICSFLPKEQYVSHGMCVKLYLELGYKIKKIHSVTRFRQERIFTKYIQKTMELRQKSRSPFQSNFWKRMNNALFVSIKFYCDYLQRPYFFIYRGRRSKIIENTFRLLFSWDKRQPWNMGAVLASQASMWWMTTWSWGSHS